MDAEALRGLLEVAALVAASDDVVIENFKVGGLARYGLDAATLRAANPGLVYCSVTGFGQTGPQTQRPAFDQVVQAMGGGRWDTSSLIARLRR